MQNAHEKETEKRAERENQLSTHSSKHISKQSTFFTGKSTARWIDVSIYGVGAPAVQAIDICVFFPYYKRYSHTTNKKQVNEQSLKRHCMLQIQSYDGQ